MRSKTIAELPRTHAGKTGWPWTEESPQLPDTMPDGSPWLGISIVTPSFNQGKFIEETIRSVLLQGYPNLEYIIIDGGSTDETVEIIRKYEKWLAFWVSEPDRGQSDAINKGIKLTNSPITTWINSDDIFLPGVFQKISHFFCANPDIDMVFGDCHIVNKKLEVIRHRDVPSDFDLKRLLTRDCYILQPSTFFKNTVFKDVGGLSESLSYAMDYDLWIRIGLKYNVKRIDAYLSCLRKHPNAKTFELSTPPQYFENLLIRKKYGGIKQAYQYYRHVLITLFKKVFVEN